MSTVVVSSNVSWHFLDIETYQLNNFITLLHTDILRNYSVSYEYHRQEFNTTSLMREISLVSISLLTSSASSKT